jgi:hypothetical protein
MAKPIAGMPPDAMPTSAGLFETYCFLTSVSSPDAELTLTENGLPSRCALKAKILPEQLVAFTCLKP